MRNISRHALPFALVALLFASCTTDSADSRPSAARIAVRAVSSSSPAAEVAREVGALLPAAEAGAAVVTFEGDALEYAFVGNESFDSRTGFEYASITKVMTAALLVVLEQEGVVDLGAPISTQLPSALDAWDGASVRDLLMHASGAPFLPPNIRPGWIWLTGRADDPFAGYSIEKLERAMSSPRLSRDRVGYRYSNFGFAVAGRVAELATGRSYAELLERRVLEPAGMELAAVDQWATPTHAPPLSRSGRATSTFTFDAMAPAGAVRGTVRDAGAFLRFAANSCDTQGSLARAICTTIQPVGVQAGSLGQGALAWVVSDRAEGTVIWHNGGTSGASTFLGFSRDTVRGVAILTNVAGLREIDEIGRVFAAGSTR